MILLASDYVGLKVTEYLILKRHYPIDLLVLDRQDRGQYNSRIAALFKSTESGIMVFDDSLKDPAFVQSLATNAPRLGILAWWPYIIRGALLRIPAKGWLNFHPSYLPFNRGKHPNFWCLVDETPCGVTLHFIDEGIDSGQIVAQRHIPVTWEDTGETLYLKSRDQIVELFEEKFDAIVAGTVQSIPQERGVGSMHKAAELDGASQIELDGTYSARRLLNIIRARMFPPHPTAFFFENGKKYSVQVIIREVR